MSRKSVYLTKKADGDLRALYSQLGHATFVKLVKDALRMCISPSYEPEVVGKVAFSPLWEDKCGEDTVHISITFGEIKDAGIVALVESCKPRQTGHFIKMAVRLAIGPYYSLGFFLNGNDKINERLTKKEMFFVGSIPQVIKSVRVVAKEEAPVTYAKPESVQAPVKPAVWAPEKKEEKSVAPVQKESFFEAPAFAENTTAGEEMSEDDVLAMLEKL